MGSMTSRPKQVIASTLASTGNVSVAGNGAATVPIVTTPDPEEIAKTRVENILRRSRSAAGTVLTSLRGVLNGTQSSPQRKNLLGE